MPTLEEWDKYLKDQEEALLRSLNTSDDASRLEGSERAGNLQVEESAKSGPMPDSDIQRVLNLRHELPPQLFDSDARSEVAQNSYVNFKESRDDLLRRLLDPQISLEDAARILNVCPTTVRRYTNKGLLRHFRTTGNQRRFRLSDVLAFLKMQSEISSDNKREDAKTGII